MCTTLLLLQEDLYYPHPLIQDLLWDSLYILGEPILTRWPFNKLREKALRTALEHIHYEDENSRYITVGCVEKVIYGPIKLRRPLRSHKENDNFNAKCVYFQLFFTYKPYK